MHSFRIQFPSRLTLFSVGVALACGGCKRGDITSYQVPKEDYSVRVAPVTASTAPATGEALPHLHWELPTDWKEKAGQQVGAGSFQVVGDEGKFAEIRVIPLRSGPDIEERSVNMWREELGLPELSAGEVKGEDVEVGGATAHLYDLTSREPRFQGKFKARTMAAILPRDGTLWFFKMSGEESLVAQQRDAFRAFLKSISFDTASHDAAVAEAPVNPATANWKVPADWQPQTPGQMVMAAYRASKGDAVVDITVAAMGGPAGGLLANVNRWRGQMKLGPISEGDLASQVKPTELPGGVKASIVDITGTNPKTGKPGRLYTLVAPREGQTWFYKMVGDPEAVAAETGNLAEFAATAH